MNDWLTTTVGQLNHTFYGAWEPTLKDIDSFQKASETNNMVEFIQTFTSLTNQLIIAEIKAYF
jgi:hypothetical protein